MSTPANHQYRRLVARHMPYCPNCGSQVDAVHHYCGACGQALSETAASEDEAPPVLERDGFLSPRSLAYVNELLGGERELDRESTAYRQLAREASGALADFARLAVVTDLDLLVLWSNGPNTDALGQHVDELNTHQLEGVVAALGLGRTLELYDDALGTEFESEFHDRLGALNDAIEEELDDERSV